MTTIGPTLIIKGDVTSKEDITIHGTLVGTLQMDGGAVMVAPHGRVEAVAEGAKLTIHGEFTGDIKATERVELTNRANVEGKIVSPVVVLQDGAVFNGSIHVERRVNTGLREKMAGTPQERQPKADTKRAVEEAVVAKVK